MGVEKPDLGVWDWVWDAVTLVGGGSTWPDSDEDSLWQYSRELLALAEILQTAGRDLGSAQTDLGNLWGGPSAAQFQNHWRYKFENVMPKLTGGAENIAEVMDHSARAIEHEKLTIVISVIWCCVELAIIALAMLFSAGFMAAANAGPILATRAVTQAAYRLLIGSLRERFIIRLGREAATEGLQELSSDATAQAIQNAEGTRDGYDGAHLLQSLKWGSVGGGIGEVLTKPLLALRNLAQKLRTPTLQWGAQTLAEGLHDQVTNNLTNYLAVGFEQGDWTPSTDNLVGAVGRFGVGVVTGGLREQIGNQYHLRIQQFIGLENGGPDSPRGPDANPTGPGANPAGTDANPAGTDAPGNTGAPGASGGPAAGAPAGSAAPAAPTGPAAPAGPAAPTGPTAPTGPAAPAGPTAPADPGDPAAPVEPTAPVGGPGTQGPAESGGPSTGPGDPAAPSTSQGDPAAPSTSQGDPAAPPAPADTGTDTPTGPASQAGTPTPGEPGAVHDAPPASPVETGDAPGTRAGEPDPVGRPGDNPTTGDAQTSPAIPGQPASEPEASAQPAPTQEPTAATPGDAGARPEATSGDSGPSRVGIAQGNVLFPVGSITPGGTRSSVRLPANSRSGQPPAEQPPPVETTPAAPVDSSQGPADSAEPTPTQTPPADTAPAGTAPVGTTPVGAAPVDTATAERDRTEQEPAEQTPAMPVAPPAPDTPDGTQLQEDRPGSGGRGGPNGPTGTQGWGGDEDPRDRDTRPLEVKMAEATLDAFYATIAYFEAVAAGTIRSEDVTRRAAARIVGKLRRDLLPEVDRLRAAVSAPVVDASAVADIESRVRAAIADLPGRDGKTVRTILTEWSNAAHEIRGLLDITARIRATFTTIGAERGPLAGRIAEATERLRAARARLWAAGANSDLPSAERRALVIALKDAATDLANLQRSLAPVLDGFAAADQMVETLRLILDQASTHLVELSTDMEAQAETALYTMASQIDAQVQAITLHRQRVIDRLATADTTEPAREILPDLNDVVQSAGNVRKQLAGEVAALSEAHIELIEARNTTTAASGSIAHLIGERAQARLSPLVKQVDQLRAQAQTAVEALLTAMAGPDKEARSKALAAVTDTRRALAEGRNALTVAMDRAVEEADVAARVAAMDQAALDSMLDEAARNLGVEWASAERVPETETTLEWVEGPTPAPDPDSEPDPDPDPDRQKPEPPPGDTGPNRGKKLVARQTPVSETPSGRRRIRFTPPAWAHDPYRNTFDVEIRFVPLPEGTPYRIRLPSDDDVRASTTYPLVVLEVSAALIGEAELGVALLGDALAESGEKVLLAERGRWLGEATNPETRPGWLRRWPRRRSAGDESRWRRLVRAAAETLTGTPAETSTDTQADPSVRVVRHLAGMGLLTDQTDSDRRRRSLRGRLTEDPEHQLIALRMMDTRSTADREAALAALDSSARRYATRPLQDEQAADRPTRESVPRNVAVTGSELLRDGDDAVLTVQLPPAEGQQGERINIAVRVVDEPAVPGAAVRLETDPDGNMTVVVRSNASDQAIAVDTAGTLAELALLHEKPKADTPPAETPSTSLTERRAVARAEAQLKVLAEFRMRSSLLERTVINQMADELLARMPAVGVPSADVDRLTALDLGARRVDSLRRVGLSYRLLIGPPDRATAGVGFHLYRRLFTAFSSWWYAEDTNTHAGRSDQQTQMTALRSFLRDPVQGLSDKKAAATVAAQSEPARFKLPGPETAPSVYRWPTHPNRAENWEKRLPGATAGGLASLIPLWKGNPDEFRGTAVQGRWAQLALSMHVLGSEVASSGFAQAEVDYIKDKPEREAANKEKHEVSLSPDERRNRAAGMLTYPVTELRETVLRLLSENGTLDPRERTRLLELLLRLRADLTEAQQQMANEVRHKLTDMAYRRRRITLFRRAGSAPVVNVDGVPMTYTMAGRGYASGAPRLSSNAGRVAGQQGATGLNSVLLQMLMSKMKGPGRTDPATTPANSTPDVPAGLPLQFTVSNALISVLGHGILYGIGWSRLKVEEVADRQAVDAWDARRAIDDTLRDIAAIERMLRDEAAPQQPAARRRLANLIMGGFGDAVRLRLADRAAGRPNEVYWWSQLFYKHGPPLLGRLGFALVFGTVLITLGAAPALLLGMLKGSLKVVAAASLGETPMRVWGPAHKRAQAQKAMRTDMAARPDTLEDMALLAVQLGEQVRDAAAKIRPAPVASSDNTPSRRARLAQVGRDLFYINTGLRDYLQRDRPPVLRPGPNRSTPGRLNPADRMAMRRIHELLGDLARSAALATRDAPPLTPESELLTGALDPELLKAELVRELARLGLLNIQPGSDIRWKAAEGFLQRRYGLSLEQASILSELRGTDPATLPPGEIRDALLEGLTEQQAVTAALQQMAESGRMELDGPIRMVELQDQSTLRFTVEGHIVGGHATRIGFEVAPLPPGVDGQLQPALPGESTRRLLISPQVMTDPARLADLFSVILSQVQEHGGQLPPGVQDIRRPFGNVPPASPPPPADPPGDAQNPDDPGSGGRGGPGGPVGPRGWGGDEDPRDRDPQSPQVRVAEATVDAVYATIAYFEALADGTILPEGVQPGSLEATAVASVARAYVAMLRQDLLPEVNRLAAALRAPNIDEAAVAALDASVHALIAALGAPAIDSAALAAVSVFDTSVPAVVAKLIDDIGAHNHLAQRLRNAQDVGESLGKTGRIRATFTALGIEGSPLAGRIAEAAERLRVARAKLWAAGTNDDLTAAERDELVTAMDEAAKDLADLHESLKPVMDQLTAADTTIKWLEDTLYDARSVVAEATDLNAAQAQAALDIVSHQIDQRVQAIVQQRQRIADQLAVADTTVPATEIMPALADAVKAANDLRTRLSRERGAMLETWMEADSARNATTDAHRRTVTRLGQRAWSRMLPLLEQVQQRETQALAAVDALLAAMTGPDEEARTKAVADVWETRKALTEARTALTSTVNHAINEADLAASLAGMDEAALDRMLDQAVEELNADSARARAERLPGTRTIRFTPQEWAQDPDRKTFDVELRFALLPEGNLYNVQVPSDADVAESETYPTVVVELSAALIGESGLDVALLKDVIADSGEQVLSARRGLWLGDSTNPETRPGWLRLGPLRLSAADKSRWRRLAQTAHERSDNPSRRVVRRLAEMGLLTDQTDSARRRGKLRRILTGGRHHRLIALRMMDTRSAADKKKVLAALDSRARRYVNRSDAAIDGVRLRQDSGESVLTVQLPATEGQLGRTVDIPVQVLDEPAVPGAAVRLATDADGKLTIVVRSDASDQAIAIDVAGTLAELALLQGEPQADAASRAVARTEAQLNTLFGFREFATPLERTLMNHMAAELLLRFRAVGVPTADNKRMTTLANWNLKREFAAQLLLGLWLPATGTIDPTSGLAWAGLARFLLNRLNVDARPTQHIPLYRLFAKPLRSLIGPPDPSTVGLGFHQFRRILSASAAWAYADLTNEHANRGPEQTEMSRNRAYVRDMSQALADNKAAGVVASQSEPVRFKPPDPDVAPSLYQWRTHPDRGENWAKRLGGAAAGGIASALPLWAKDPGDFNSSPVQGRWAQLALSAYVLGGEVGGTGFGQAEADYVKDKPEREAADKEKHEVSLSPDARRNSAAGLLTYPLGKLYEKVRKLRNEGGTLDPQDRARLLTLLRRLRADLTEAQSTMAREVEHKLRDMEYRRQLITPIRRAGAVPVAWLDGRAVTYTMAGRGYASGAPRLSDNMGRVGVQQVPGGVNSVLTQLALNAMRNKPPLEEALALKFSVVNGVVTIVGQAFYGAGWSQVKVDEVADRQAVEAWDARRAIDDALRDIDHIERMVWGNDLPQRPAAQRQINGLRDRIKRRLFDPAMGGLANRLKGGFGDAARQRMADSIAGRPNDIYWWSQLFSKHGPATLARLALTLAGGTVLVLFGASPALLIAMLKGSLTISGANAIGETPMRVWGSAHKRAQSQRALHMDMAARPDSLVDMAQMAMELGETVKTAAAEITPAPVVDSRDDTPSRRDRVAQVGRDARNIDAGLRSHLLRNLPSVLRPGPNRPEPGRLNTADRTAMKRVRARLEDLERAARLADRNAPVPAAIEPDMLEADLVRRFAELGLLDSQPGSEERWVADADFLKRRYGLSDEQLGRLRTISAVTLENVRPGKVHDALVESLADHTMRHRVTTALQQMAESGQMERIGPLHMVEFQDSNTLRFTVPGRIVEGLVNELVRFEVTPLPAGLDAQLRPGSPGDPVRRLLIAPQTMLDPARLADTFTVLLSWLQESGVRLPPGVQDIGRDALDPQGPDRDDPDPGGPGPDDPTPPSGGPDRPDAGPAAPPPRGPARSSPIADGLRGGPPATTDPT